MYDLLFIKLSCCRLSETNVFLICLAMPLDFQEELPDQGSNPQPLQWKCSLNHWTIREVLDAYLRVLPAFTASPAV